MPRWITKMFGRTRTQPTRRCPLGVEWIEDRTLPSVTLGAADTLAITGTAGSDHIQIDSTAGGVRVEFDGRVYSFAASSVARVSVSGGAGNDSITNDTSLPFTARGGAGSDTLIGGGGHNSLFGGLGNDVIVGHSGFDTFAGGAGHDRADGGTGCEGSLLSASLTDPTSATGASGRITLLPGQTSLRVDVTGLTVGATYAVQVGDTAVGTFTADDNGEAETTLTGVTAAVAAGTTVAILDATGATVLTGTFAAPTTGSGGGCEGEGHGAVSLVADLTGDSGVTGHATIFTSPNSGQSLRVEADGLTAGATYTVQIAGTTVGTFTADNEGEGEIALDSLTQTVAAGDTASVLDDSGATVLTGTLATPTMGGWSGHGGFGWHHGGPGGH
jgi:hypothetical protein